MIHPRTQKNAPKPKTHAKKNAHQLLWPNATLTPENATAAKKELVVYQRQVAIPHAAMSQNQTTTNINVTGPMPLHNAFKMLTQNRTRLSALKPANNQTMESATSRTTLATSATRLRILNACN